jgi:hypothetical protein
VVGGVGRFRYVEIEMVGGIVGQWVGLII